MPDPSDLDKYPVFTLGDQPEGFSPQIGDNGRAFMGRLEDDDRPSLSKPVRNPSSGQAYGIGGTVVGSEGSFGSGAKAKGPSFESRSERPLTPEEMMAQADAYEQDFLSRTKEVEQRGSQGSTVSNLYGQQPYGGDMFEPHGEPDWLKNYMERQPFTDPYHQTPMSGVDMVNNNKYLSEREKLRMLKSLRLSQ